MLKSWAVSNFKSILKTRVINPDETETDKLSLKPLTVFCGANSSGKSSLIQSILLLVQTMRHHDRDLPLVLNGEYIRLGSFADIVSGKSKKKSVSMEFSYIPKSGFDLKFLPEAIIRSISYKLFFDYEKEQKLLPTLSGFELTLDCLYDKNIGSEKIYYSYFNNIDWKKVLPLEFKYLWNDKTVMETIIAHDIDGKHIFANDIDFSHFVPNNIPHDTGLNAAVTLALYNFFNFPNSKEKSKLFSEDIKKCYEPSFLTEYYIGNSYNNAPGSFLCFLEDVILSDIPGIRELFSIAKYSGYNDYHAIFSYSEWHKFLSALPESTINTIKKRMEKHYDEIIRLIFNDLWDVINNIDYQYDIGEGSKEFIYTDSDFEFGTTIGHFHELFSSYESKSIGVNEEFFDSLSTVFEKNISYLGPLREEPKIVYPFSDFSGSIQIGRKGENTAAILAHEGSIGSGLPPIPNMDKLGKSKDWSLLESVIEWSKYIGIAEDIEAKITKDGYTLRVKTPGSRHFSELPNVGVGVSQVLPILVMCLSVKWYSTIIIEQPELHLHPKMQSKLMDFLLAVSRLHKQVIVETHSEHFINALRLRIAKASPPNDEKIAEDIQIYFTSKDEKGTKFKSIQINKYSALSDWPEDFFDEEEIAREEIIESVGQKLRKDFPNG